MYVNIYIIIYIVLFTSKLLRIGSWVCSSFVVDTDYIQNVKLHLF